MTTLTIRLPDRLRRQLEKLSRERGRAAGEIVRDSLRRYLAVERFRSRREQALPFAEAQGLLTDDDIFDVVSLGSSWIRNVLLAAFAVRGLREALFAVCLAHHWIVSAHIPGELRRHPTERLRMTARPPRRSPSSPRVSTTSA
jgi:predicted transcriptional regulator